MKKSMDKMDAIDPKQNDRQIRVFISSTFKDMQAERNYLVKIIFPQLRKLCESRAVVWTEVDLRWGITEAESSEGKVLPLCLAEIERCRPYFIGLLGERYGWVPESYSESLVREQPWLKEHLHHSVTELEIIHGVLKSPEMLDRSLFYFRDPKYIKDKSSDFICEDEQSREKLKALKQRIRDKYTEGKLKYTPRENYPTPEAVGGMILADFTQIIDSLFPSDQIPDPLDQEAARHEAYARSRRLAFVGREDLLKRMTDHVSAGGKPLVLTGDSGCGKSALLAEWAARWRKDHPEDLVIQHYIGSTPDSADWQGLVRRILGELKCAYNIPDELPIQPDALRNALNDWLVKAAGRRRIILMLDALNQLTDADAAHQLGWLPLVFPPNVRVLASSLAGDTYEAVHKRQWPELNVPLFGKEDIAPAAIAYFKVFGKTPDDRMLQALEAAPAAPNALYLRAILDELRQFGEYQQLPQRTAWYLAATDLPALFDRILTRWHDDFGKDPEHPDLVRRSLCLIACSRFGLSESELLDLLGKKNEQGEQKPMPRRPWTPFYLAAENSLSIRTGLLNFGHDYIRTAVQKRWLANEQVVHEFRLQLAGYFRCIPEPTYRKLDELPWQLSRLNAWDELYALVADPKFYSFFYRHSQRDALSAWSAIERETGYRITDAYYPMFWRPEDYSDDILEVVSNLLGVTGNWSELLRFRETLIEHYTRRNDTSRMTTNLLGQASLLVSRGNLDEALSVLAKHGSLVWRTQEPWVLQEFLHVKSMALWQKGELGEAMGTLKSREELCRVAGFEHQLAGTLSQQSFIMQLRGNQDVAERLLEESQRISRESGDIGGYQSVVGEFGLLLLKKDDLNGAMAKFSEQERICRELGDLVSLAGCLGNRGAVYSLLGRENDALAMYKEMETLASKVGHEVLYHVSRSCQANVIYLTNHDEKAQALIDEAVIFFRSSGLAERLATSLVIQGHIYSFRLAPEKADRVYEEGLELLQQLSSPQEVAETMYKVGSHYFAVFLSCQPSNGTILTFDDFSRHAQRASQVGHYLEHAEKYLRKALQICPDCAEFHQCLGDVLAQSGDIDGAIASYRRTLEIRPDWTDISVQLADLLIKKETLS